MEPTTRIELVTSSLPRTRSYQLSYVGPNLERETGIEPATNSLEGCDSTTELLPPFVPLSYIHRGPSLGSGFRRAAQTPRRRLNLEGCDSTTELLPPFKTSCQHSAVSIQPSSRRFK